MAPRVVIVSGHMVDSDDRPVPRFPSTELDRVGRLITNSLAGWGVAEETTVVTGGARGADILAAEAALGLRATVHLCLAVPVDEFERRSVALPGTDWGDRFRAVVAASSVEVVSPGGGPDEVVFPRANARILAYAREVDPMPYALVVWDRAAGDASGGTADMVSALADLPPERMCVIEPIRTNEPDPQ